MSNGAADATGLSVQGPMARTVRDAAAMLDALAVPMPGDPYWAPPLPPARRSLATRAAIPAELQDRPVRDTGQRYDA